MTAEQQVKEIILMLNPENASTQTDAVFLVQQYMSKMRDQLAAKDKQIALTEAKCEAEAKLRHDVENEKLAERGRLEKEKADIMEGKGMIATKTKPEQLPADTKGKGKEK